MATTDAIGLGLRLGCRHLRWSARSRRLIASHCTIAAGGRCGGLAGSRFGSFTSRLTGINLIDVIGAQKGGLHARGRGHAIREQPPQPMRLLRAHRRGLGLAGPWCAHLKSDRLPVDTTGAVEVHPSVHRLYEAGESGQRVAEHLLIAALDSRPGRAIRAGAGWAARSGNTLRPCQQCRRWQRERAVHVGASADGAFLFGFAGCTTHVGAADSLEIGIRIDRVRIDPVHLAPRQPEVLMRPQFLEL